MFNDYFNLLSVAPGIFGIVCILSYFFKNKRFFVDPRKLAYGASSTGILLTFFGIWQGLIGFDVTNTEGSIPVLLEGLKLAFGSSIVGLFTSLFINLLFVQAQDPEEKSLENVEKLLKDLNINMGKFTLNLANANVEALSIAIENLVKGLDMGINKETQETINKFKISVEMLRDWQERYIEEIAVVTDAMDKNAIVTKATTEHLQRTNEVLAELKPVTETIAESIGWVQKALPSFRKKVEPVKELTDEEILKKPDTK
jgi:hypothetical protein